LTLFYKTYSRLNKSPLHSIPKVAVGFGSCIDVVADGLSVLDKFEAVSPDVPEHHESLSNYDEFLKTFAYFYEHGAAGERYVSNETLFKLLVDTSMQIKGAKKAPGGNAVVMASRFLKEGCDVMLAATYSDELFQMIDHDVKIVGEKLLSDDIHLLLEYDKLSKWGSYTAPRANRFIVHADNNNPFLKSLSEFAKNIIEYSPSLVVVSGLQMMDSFPFKTGERLKIMLELNDVLKSLDKKVPIHLELASFAEKDCMKDILNHVVPLSDSLGMNEQELPNLMSMMTNDTITLISDPYPRIATTLDNMRLVYETLRGMSDSERKVSRIHVHTLAYQVILTSKNTYWKNTMSAAAKAALTANRHVCGSSEIHIDKARLIMDDSFSISKQDKSKRIPFDSSKPVSCWEESDFEICIAPNLVCTEIVQTGGGGDNISSAGLVLQI